MNDFQISLAIIGLIFIIGVFLFNRWQEQKYRKQTEKMFQGDRQDVLFDTPAAGVRLEPSLETFPFAVDSDSDVKSQPITKKTSTVATTAYNDFQEPEELSSLKVAEPIANDSVEDDKKEPVIDEAIDLIAVIKLPKAMAVDNFKRFISRTQTFTKPVNWEGLFSGRWKPLSAGFYSEIRIAMQLADRRGPVTVNEISDFSGMIKQFAVELDGDAHAETETSAGERATELDGFCADVDVEIGVNIIAGQTAMPAAKLRTLAEASGMTLNEDGVFHFSDANGQSLFTLRNAEPRPFLPDHVKNITTRSVILLLDVPRVSNGIQAFDQMLQLGQHIADAMEAKLVDDNGKELTDAGADSIRRQLHSLYQIMDGFEISAGSGVALRLFS